MCVGFPQISQMMVHIQLEKEIKAKRYFSKMRKFDDCNDCSTVCQTNNCPHWLLTIDIERWELMTENIVYRFSYICISDDPLIVPLKIGSTKFTIKRFSSEKEKKQQHTHTLIHAERYSRGWIHRLHYLLFAAIRIGWLLCAYSIAVHGKEMGHFQFSSICVYVCFGYVEQIVCTHSMVDSR